MARLGKYKLLYRIVCFLVFVAAAYMRFEEYSEKGKNELLVFAIAFTLLALITAGEVISILRTKKEKSINI